MDDLILLVAVVGLVIALIFVFVSRPGSRFQLGIKRPSHDVEVEVGVSADPPVAPLNDGLGCSASHPPQQPGSAGDS